LSLLVERFCADVEKAARDKRLEWKVRALGEYRVSGQHARVESVEIPICCSGSLEDLDASRELVDFFCRQIGHDDPLFFLGGPEESPSSIPYYAVRHFSRLTDSAFEIDSARLTEYLRKLIKAVRADKIEYTYRQSLLGVELAFPSIPLSKDVSLVRLSDQEVAERLGFLQPVPDPYDVAEIPCHTQRVEIRIRQPAEHTPGWSIFSPNPPDFRESARQRAEQVRTAVMLHNPRGYPDLGDYFFAPQRLLEYVLKPPSERAGPLSVSDPIALSAEHVPRLERCFQIVCSGTRKPLMTALRRFRLACDRLSYEDSVVDLVIAMEALLVGGDTWNIKACFIQNGASFGHWALGLSREEGGALCERAYKARCSAVHGSDNVEIDGSLWQQLRTMASNLIAWIAENGLEGASGAIEGASPRPGKKRMWKLLHSHERASGYRWPILTPMPKR